MPAAVAVVHWSMTDVMFHRLTRTATASWRDPPAARADRGGRTP
ncbi:hypothetical protein ACIQC7_34670 [Kitasatospora sp. NPDC088556]